MNREFKKIKSKMETRYVLEAASAGATSAGAVATGPVAKDNLLVQDKDGKPQVQRRNPVAANVNATVGGGGSGAHKDRKRAEKRGEQKHKKDWRDVSENEQIEEGWKSALAGAALSGAMALGGMNSAQAADLSGFNSTYLQQVVKGEHPRPMVSVDAAKAELKAREEGKPEPTAIRPSSSSQGFSADYLQSVVDGTHPRPMISKEKAQELLSQMKEDYGAGGYMTATGGAQISKAVPETEVDPGYIDQENDMTASDLKSLYKQAVRLRDLIQKMGDNTTLEPWQQTKIAKAADYVNAVFRSLDNEYGLDSLEEKIKGTDGKACWKGYRYAGTEDGKDKCVPVNEEAKKGLWANIHARRKKGLPARKPGEAGAPSKKSWDAAVSASKKKKAVGEDNLAEYETHTYTDKMGRKWRVDDEGNKDLIYDPTDRFTKRSYTSAYPKSSQPSLYYFYNVPNGAAMKAFELGLKKTKSGKWYSATPNTEAEKEFGKARMWKPKAEESMMPASHFAGTPKNKLGPAAHLKGKMKRPARQGDLVGGGAEESYSKKKTLKKN